MPVTIAVALAGAIIALGAAPYLARLTVSVPDKSLHTWWLGARVDTRRLSVTAAVAAVLGALAGYAAGWHSTAPAFC